MFAQAEIEELKNRADIVEVIGAHVRLKRAGRNYVGLCPFHQEKTPSFSVNRERGFFHCFGCAVGGTVFNFVMRTEGLSFPEAVRSLAHRYGVRLSERGEDPRAAGEREAMARAAELAADFFAHVLWRTPDGEAARAYLSRRGIAEETARAFKLGFAPARPAALAKALAARGLEKAGARIGLVRTTGDGPRDMFHARLMFPIDDGRGRIIAFGGRVLDDRLPKYINSPESPLYSKGRSLYGLAEARQAIGRADRAIVVEGYIDAIALWQAGFQETVASLGTSLTAEQLGRLGRYTRNVLACFDGDPAGRAASLRALRVFVAAGLEARAIFIPQGFDPDTLVRERGAAAFAAGIESAEPLVDLFLREERRQAGASLSGRARAAERVAELLRLVGNPFEFDLMARKAAEALGVREEVLRKEARSHAPARPGRPQPVARPLGALAGPSALQEAELGLLALALLHGALRSRIGGSACLAEFDDPGLAALVAQLCQSDRERVGLEFIVAERLSEQNQSRLSAILVGPLMNDLKSAARLCEDYCAELKRAGRERRARMMARAAGSADSRQAVESAQAAIELRRGIKSR